jgi:hypothetical protein
MRLIRGLSPRVGRLPTPAEAMLYDAVMLVATAAREAGPESGAIRDYLMSLGRGREPYQGVTGLIAPGAPSRSGRLVMGILSGGRLVPASMGVMGRSTP